MTPEQFCYWLQGFAEIHQDQPNGQEWLIIMDHLARVFRKETPDRKKTIDDLKRQYDQSKPYEPPRQYTWPDRPWTNPPEIIC